MKKIILLIYVSVTICFYSCSNNGGNIKVTPVSEQVNGDLTNYIQIVKNDYQVSPDGEMIIKIKAIGKMTEEELFNKKVLISAILLDEKEMPISAIKELEIQYSYEEKLISILKAGSGETFINCKVNYSEKQIKANDDNICKFSITSIVRNREWGEGVETKDSETLNTTESNGVQEGVIKDFVDAENNRDINKIITYFSNTGIEKYYKMYSPTIDEVKNKYLEVWSKSKFANNNIKTITQNDDGSYILITDFTSTSNANKETKVNNATVQFRFNTQGKIVSISNDIENSTNNSTDNYSTNLNNSIDENFDKYLDDYEKFMDEYISFFDKASKGDLSAITQTTALMEKAETLDRSMKKAKNENKLNSQQIQRLIKLESKLLNASANMMSNYPKMK